MQVENSSRFCAQFAARISATVAPYPQGLRVNDMHVQIVPDMQHLRSQKCDLQIMQQIIRNNSHTWNPRRRPPDRIIYVCCCHITSMSVFSWSHAKKEKLTHFNQYFFQSAIDAWFIMDVEAQTDNTYFFVSCMQPRRDTFLLRQSHVAPGSRHGQAWLKPPRSTYSVPRSYWRLVDCISELPGIHIKQSF